MGFFKRRNKEFLDLTEKYKKSQEKAAEMQADSTNSTTDNSGAFGFLGNMASASSSSSDATESYTPGTDRETQCPGSSHSALGRLPYLCQYV